MASNSTNKQLQVCDNITKQACLKPLRTDIKHLTRAKNILRMVTTVGPSMRLVLK